MGSNIQNILYENENILWQGKPERKPYIIGGVLAAIPIAIFGMFFAGVVVFMAIAGRHTAMSWAIFLMPHFWIGITMMFGPFIYAFLSYSRIAYAITDKRVLIESGILNFSIRSLDYDKLSNATVNIGIVDNWYNMNTGSIFLSSPGIGAMVTVNGRMTQLGQSNVLSHIKDPYKVFKFFEKVEMDIKTDMNYPNALRPAANPGYQSNYQKPPI